MGFKLAKSISGEPRHQGDIVALNTPPSNSVVTEELKLPGVLAMADMTEQQLLDFFTVVWKSRRFITEVFITLGTEYKQQEINCNTAFSNKLHEQTAVDNAKASVLALSSNPRAIGIRASIFTDKIGNGTSYIKLIVSDKISTSVSVDEEGNEIAGDPEFNPQLFVTYLAL